MSIADKLKERIAFQAKSFHVTEWDTDVYCTPFTCGELDKLQKRHPGFLNNLAGEAMVDLIVMKALDENGKQLFTLKEKPYLLREEATVINDVASKLIAQTGLEDTPEKN